MSNILINSLLPLLALLVISWAFNFPFLNPKKTTLTFYVHDYMGGEDGSAITVAGKDGANTNPFLFGSLVAVDDLVTDGPEAKSREIGRAQGMYINSKLDGKGLHVVFSVVFTDGEFKGSTLEIQGTDVFDVEETEFSVVSGTGYFRFVRGYSVVTTVMEDIPNLKAILKHHVTVKHY